MALGDLSGCATIMVSLNEAAAETIYTGLVRRGATAAPHWAEAFERSSGLTLEFTHILTRGHRLDDVVGEQVRRCVDEGRLRELEVLSLVSVADRWAAMIATADVTRACDVTDFELRQAVSRLAEEHLLVEQDGYMYGLHRLRSTAISNAIHSQPPPDLTSTVRKVLGLVPVRQLHRFIANMLSENPSAGDVVIETAVDESLQLNRIVAYLHGLRLADFYELAKQWKDIADQHAVPASSQPVLFHFSAAGLSFPDFFPPELRAASTEMASATGTHRGTDLTARVGQPALANLLASIDDPHDAAQLLSTLEGIGPAFTAEVARLLAEPCPFVTALKESNIEALAICIAGARTCEPFTGRASCRLDRRRGRGPAPATHP